MSHFSLLRVYFECFLKCKTHEMGNCNVRQHNTVCATLFLRLVCKPTTRYKTRHACGVKRKLVCKGMHKCIIPISDRHGVWCKMGLKGFVVWWLVLSVLQLPLSYSQGSGQFSTCTREWVHLLRRLCCLVHFYMLLPVSKVFLVKLWWLFWFS
jgi:hypothetical protein